MEVSELASIMAMPREGHLKDVFSMFLFLKNKNNGVMFFDPSEPDIDENQFNEEDWSVTAYGECKEEVSPNAPMPRVIGFTMRVFIGSDHADNTVIRIPRTRYMVFMNSAPIFWFYNKQTIIKTSSFGKELI